MRENTIGFEFVFGIDFYTCIFQGDNSMTESRTEKQKSDDPVVDLFPEDEAEERNSTNLF